MPLTVRNEANRRAIVDQLVRQANYAALPQALTNPTIGNGTTAGNLRTTVAATFRAPAGGLDSLASTDDHWDLSAETDTPAATYGAYWLYNDGTFSAQVTAATLVGAVRALPAPDTDLAVFGVFVAGPSTDFNAGGGLSAQGTIINGLPLGWLDEPSNLVPGATLNVIAP